MTTDPVRFAVIGLDHWYSAIPLARAIVDSPEAELVGLADADPDRARQVAAQLGNPDLVTQADALLDDPAIDAVALYASVDRNPDACVRAAEQGKHIVSVKPLARTLEEATRILHAVRQAGVTFVPSESRARATGFARRLRTWADEGRFGKPLTATFQAWTGLPSSWPGATDSGWFTDPDRAPGGGWIDHSIYHIDLLRWAFRAEVIRVDGRTANLKHPQLQGSGLEDYGHAQLEFDNGMHASVEDTWTAPPGGGRQSLSIVGTEGAVAYDSLTGRFSAQGSMHPFDGWAHIAEGPGQPNGIEDILDAVRGNAYAYAECAWRNLASCLAFYRAAETGRGITPETPPEPVR